MRAGARGYLLKGADQEELLRAAVAEQDTHWFTEPPPWYFPVRQALGAVLLKERQEESQQQLVEQKQARAEAARLDTGRRRYAHWDAHWDGERGQELEQVAQDITRRLNF